MLLRFALVLLRIVSRSASRVKGRDEESSDSWSRANSKRSVSAVLIGSNIRAPINGLCFFQRLKKRGADLSLRSSRKGLRTW